MLAFIMVFTGMGIGSWGMDTAWASGWDGTPASELTQVDGVYQISSASELALFAKKVNAGTAETQNAVLTQDIDLNNQEWTPIGNSDAHPYNGTFDGANHSVQNLSITKGAMYVGLFGYMVS